MYRQGGSRAEMWRLKSVPPVAFNQEQPNLTEGGLDVQGGYLPPCSQGLFHRRDERPRGGPSVRATPGHSAQDARVLRAPRVSTATTGSQTEARSIQGCDGPDPGAGSDLTEEAASHRQAYLRTAQRRTRLPRQVHDSQRLRSRTPVIPARCSYLCPTLRDMPSATTAKLE